jgi:hypothetical protein
LQNSKAESGIVNDPCHLINSKKSKSIKTYVEVIVEGSPDRSLRGNSISQNISLKLNAIHGQIEFPQVITCHTSQLKINPRVTMDLKIKQNNGNNKLMLWFRYDRDPRKECNSLLRLRDEIRKIQFVEYEIEHTGENCEERD